MPNPSDVKTCTTCGNELEPGQRTTCDPCKRDKRNAYHRQWEQDHPRPKRSNRLPPNSNRTDCNNCGGPLDGASKVKCKKCFREYMKEYRESNPEYKLKAYQAHVRKKYGLEPEQFEAMWNEQDGKCEICARELHRNTGLQDRSGQSACVDHNHETSATRGLLCQDCNRGIGGLKDSLELIRAAEQYLIRYS